MLPRVCRCCELVKRSVMMLSLASSNQRTPASTTSRQEDRQTSRQCPDTRPLTDADADSTSTTKSLHLDLSSLSDSSSPPAQTTRPPTAPTHTTHLPLLSAGARESMQHAVQLVNEACHDLCHVIQQHLSQHDVISSASSSTVSASSSRRMLPIVPGTSTLPGAALRAAPGSVLGRGSSLAVTANMLRCQSARAAESRHVSVVCFPLKQHSNEL